MITQRVLARAIEQVDDAAFYAAPEIVPATVAGLTFVAEPPTLHEEVQPRPAPPPPLPSVTSSSSLLRAR